MGIGESDGKIGSAGLGGGPDGGLRDLVRHPASRGGSGLSVRAGLALRDNALVLEFLLADAGGAPFSVVAREPAADRAGQRRDGLWRTTCFEAFVGTTAGTAYREFNLSPSGDWAVYDFDAPRLGMQAAAIAAPPLVAFRKSPSAMRLSASLRAVDAAPAGHDVGMLMVGLAVVVEEQGGSMSWWGLAHAGDRPDFHDPAGRTLALQFAAPSDRTRLIAP